MGMTLRDYTSLGVASVTSGTPQSLLALFPTKLPSKTGKDSSPLVNTIFIQAHEGNGSDLIYIGDSDMVGGNDDTRGQSLAAREWTSFSSGANGNCLDPRNVKIDCSAGTKKVRVQLLKV